jgi:hypothetical protein
MQNKNYLIAAGIGILASGIVLYYLSLDNESVKIDK